MIRFSSVLVFFAFLILSCSSACGVTVNKVFIGSYFNEDYRYTVPLIIEFYEMDSAQMTVIGSNSSSQILYFSGDSLVNTKKKYHFTLQQNRLVLTNNEHSLYFTAAVNNKKHRSTLLAGKSFSFKKQNGGDFDVVEEWNIVEDSIYIYRVYCYENNTVYTEIERVEYIKMDYCQNITLLAMTDKGRPFEIYECFFERENLSLLNAKTGEIENGQFMKKASKLEGFDFLVQEKQHIYQYYQFDRKPMPTKGFNWLKKETLSKFSDDHFEIEDGFITLRFVLSQEGKVGRLALEQMNLKYSQIHYPSPLIVNIIEIVRSIEWDVAENEGIPVDCQLFLIFKIEKGKLIDVYV